MKLINRITAYILVFVVILIVVCITLVVAFLIYRGKKSTRLKMDENYRDAKVKDAEDFIPVEDVADNMIITKGRKRFVAVIRCRGFDFYTANDEEKLRTKNNYRSFISAFSSRVTYRLFGEDINMDYTMKMYQDTYHEMQETAFNEAESYKEIKEAYKQARDTGSPQIEDLAKYLSAAERRLTAYDWRLKHMESQMQYISRVSGPEAGRQRLVQTYVLDWSNSDELITGILTEEQLHKKAVKELDKICRVKIRQLNDAGVKAIRCNNGELIDMLHHHCHPVSGNRYRFDQLKDSTYFDLISTTDTLDQMDMNYEDELIQEMMIGGGANV